MPVDLFSGIRRGMDLAGPLIMKKIQNDYEEKRFAAQSALKKQELEQDLRQAQYKHLSSQLQSAIQSGDVNMYKEFAGRLSSMGFPTYTGGMPLSKEQVGFQLNNLLESEKAKYRRELLGQKLREQRQMVDKEFDYKKILAEKEAAEKAKLESKKHGYRLEEIRERAKVKPKAIGGKTPEEKEEAEKKAKLQAYQKQHEYYTTKYYNALMGADQFMDEEDKTFVAADALQNMMRIHKRYELAGGNPVDLGKAAPAPRLEAMSGEVTPMTDEQVEQGLLKNMWHKFKGFAFPEEAKKPVEKEAAKERMVFDANTIAERIFGKGMTAEQAFSDPKDIGTMYNAKQITAEEAKFLLRTMHGYE